MERSPPNIDPPTRLALAVYYGECHSRGISQKRAAAAEEDVAKQSKWWIRGDDPNHPAHTSLRDATIKSNKDGEASSSNIESAEAKEPENDDSANNDDEDDQEESDSDWDAPIFAYDDDFTAAPGSLQFSRRNARYNRNRNSITYPLASASSKTPFTVSTGSTLLPIWLDRSQGATSKPILSEDVLRPYSTYPYTDLCCTSTTHPLSSSQSTNTAHPITSESEADDSLYRSEMSTDDSSSVVASRRIKSNKRLKLSEPFEASLDETFLQARIDHDIDEAKKDLLSRLGDGTSSKSFSKCLRRLEDAARRRKISPGGHGQDDIEGTWIMVSPPDYPGSCLGTNVKGDKLYTLERMSFGMYEPHGLLCSIQQQFK